MGVLGWKGAASIDILVPLPPPAALVEGGGVEPMPVGELPVDGNDGNGADQPG